MKVAYIAYPIGGNVSENLNKVIKIIRSINLYEPEVIPFAHYFVDCHALNDDIPEERERGIKNDIALMKKGFIDEVRLYGDRISEGMSHEIELAHKLGITVRPLSEATKKAYNDTYI